MDKEKVVTLLKELIVEVMPMIDSDIDMKASITDEYGVNSISIIRLIVACENKFDVSFTDYELALSAYDSFEDLADLIVEKLEY